jgi:hypothetical protein
MKKKYNLLIPAIWGFLFVFLFSVQTKGQNQFVDLPMDIRQLLNQYTNSISNYAQKRYEDNNQKSNKPMVQSLEIDSITTGFKALFSVPTSLVVNDFPDSINIDRDLISNTGISIGSYLESLDRFSKRNKLNYYPLENNVGYSIIDISQPVILNRPLFSIYQIETTIKIAYKPSIDFKFKSKTIIRYFTIIRYNPLGIWAAAPKICRIADRKESIRAIYPYQLLANGMSNINTPDFLDISDHQFVPIQFIGGQIDVRLTNHRNSIILLNTGIQFETRSFGLAADSYHDSIPRWNNQIGSTLVTTGSSISHNLRYELLSFPVNLKYQYEANRFYFNGHFGVRLATLLSESYQNTTGSIKTSNDISIRNGSILEHYHITDVPKLGLQQYEAQIQDKSFFNLVSKGYQIGIGSGFKINPQWRIGVNLEYSQYFLNPRDLSVDIGYIKPLNYSQTAYSMKSIHGSIAVSYVLGNMIRPFYRESEHKIQIPLYNSKTHAIGLDYDLTSLRNIKNSVAFSVQDTLTKKVYQRGTLKTKEIGKLKMVVSEGSSLVLVKPNGIDLIAKGLETSSIKDLLIIPFSNLNIHNLLKIDTAQLKPEFIWILYTSNQNGRVRNWQDSVIHYIDTEYLKREKSNHSAFIEGTQYKFIRGIQIVDTLALHAAIKNPPGKGDFIDNIKIEFSPSRYQFSNRIVVLTFFVDTEEAFNVFIKPAIKFFQFQTDLIDNSKNLRIEVRTRFNPTKLKEKLGLMEKSWNISQIN